MADEAQMLVSGSVFVETVCWRINSACSTSTRVFSQTTRSFSTVALGRIVLQPKETIGT